jgi:hypothetical protein
VTAKPSGSLRSPSNGEPYKSELTITQSARI